MFCCNQKELQIIYRTVDFCILIGIYLNKYRGGGN